MSLYTPTPLSKLSIPRPHSENMPGTQPVCGVREKSHRVLFPSSTMYSAEGGVHSASIGLTMEETEAQKQAAYYIL